MDPESMGSESKLLKDQRSVYSMSFYVALRDDSDLARQDRERGENKPLSIAHIKYHSAVGKETLGEWGTHDGLGSAQE